MIRGLAPAPTALNGLETRAGIQAVKSASNPTLNLQGAAPENIIKVGSTYYLCYTRRVNTDTPTWHVGLAHASSPNPTSWTDDGSILTAGSQAWEDDSVEGIVGAWLMEDSGTFYLFYGSNTGSGSGIGYATASTVTGPYTKYASNPVLSPEASGWDSLRCHEPSVINDGGTWLMAYMGEDSDFDQGTTEKVGVATASSPSGPWTKAAGNPVIGFGASGTMDAAGAADPSWLISGGKYWLWYTGLTGVLADEQPWYAGLAYADAATGPFTRHPSNPVLMVDLTLSTTFDNRAAFRGGLFLDGTTFYLPYAGIPSSGNSVDLKGGDAVIAMFIRP